MPPHRRRSRASQKECDERLSIAETIAGLANSIEQPTSGVITRQNSYDERSSANFARLPSMVAEEVAGPAVSLHSLVSPVRSASVDGTADTANVGHMDIPTRKLTSQTDRVQVHAQSQPSVCNASNVVSCQSINTVITPGVSENIICTQTHTVSCSASMSLNSDTVFSAVLMGWNPPVLASCPSASIESVSPGDVSSPLSALRTVDSANNNSNVEVLKLPLVFQPVSDGTWLLVPMSESAAFGASVLPNTECVIQTVAQHSGLPAQIGYSGQPLSVSIAPAGVGNSCSVSNELLTAIDSSRLQLHSLSSFGVPGSYYNGSDGCSVGLPSTVTSKAHQELFGIVNNVSSIGDMTPSSHLISGASSSEDAVSGSSILGSLGALRDYYKRISTHIVQSSSLPATSVQILNSAASVASVGNDRISCTDAVHSKKIPAVSLSASNDQVVQPVLCSVDVSAARNFDILTKLNVKHMSSSSVAASVDDENLSLRKTSHVLPAVSVCDSTNKPLSSESHCDLDRSKCPPALLTDGGCEQSSPKRPYKLLCHLPPKKRRKISVDVHWEAKQNGCQHKTSEELDDEQTVDDGNKNINVDPPDILLTEEIVTHTEHPLSAKVAVSGTSVLNTNFLLKQ